MDEQLLRLETLLSNLTDCKRRMDIAGMHEIYTRLTEDAWELTLAVGCALERQVKEAYTA